MAETPDGRRRSGIAIDVAAPGANFQGSFFVDSCRQKEKPYEVPGKRAAIHRFLSRGWDNRLLYKSAFVECVGTMLQVYLSACIGITIANFETKLFPVIVGLSNWLVITLFIYATAAPTGGHLNPLITFSTLLTGLSGFSRSVLYILAQVIGASVAGGMIRGSFGETVVKQYVLNKTAAPTSVANLRSDIMEEDALL